MSPAEPHSSCVSQSEWFIHFLVCAQSGVLERPALAWVTTQLVPCTVGALSTGLCLGLVWVPGLCCRVPTPPPNPYTPMSVTVFGNRVYRCDRLRMRSCGIKVALNPMTGVFIRKGQLGPRFTGNHREEGL